MNHGNTIDHSLDKLITGKGIFLIINTLPALGMHGEHVKKQDDRIAGHNESFKVFYC